MFKNSKPSIHYMIKLSLCALAICIMLMSLLVTESQAATGITNGSVVNVRSAPSNVGQIIGTILKDTQVEILATSGDWYQIKYAKLEGYVSRELITASQQVQVVNGPINARSGPGTSFDVVASLADKVALTVLGEKDGWYQILLPDGSSAYAAGWLVTLLDQDSAAQTEPTATTTAVAAPATTISSSSAPSVILNGSQLQFDVAPRIENGRTLVPLRAIFEAMGADVEWDETTRTVTARNSSTNVVLPLGSTSPTVNGQIYKLEVPAQIVNDRTLAPLRFVSEAFGGTVDWNEQTRVINIAYTASATPSAVVVTGEQVNLREGPSTSSAKIDSAQTGEQMTVLAEKNGWYQVSRGSITAWVASWVVEPLTDAIAVTEPTTNSSTDTASSADSESSDVTPTSSDINSRGDENASVAKGFITISTRLASDGYRLVMKTAEAAEPTVSESQDGKKITYTFKNAALKSTRDEAYFYIGSGNNARVPITAETMDDTTWVTIEMPLAYQYIKTEEASGCKQVFTIPSQLTSVDDMTLKNGNQIIVLKATSAMEYQDSFTDGKIKLSLSKTGKGFAEDSYTFTGVGNQVSIKGVSGEQSVQVQISTTSGLDTYQVSRNLSGEQISIILVNKNKITTTEPTSTTTTVSPATIVLDPGHGGQDTGAVSKSRTLNEKDVVLAIGLKARDILEKAGYKVIMTREDDTFIDLEERPAIANKAGADLFVSIHCDSVEGTDAHGTGTFYYAPDTNQTLYAQDYQRSLLADLLQKAMLQECGRTDRSIRQANYCVLRDTTMPSALVETAFISNPEEEQLLASEDFQNKAAQAIAEGIEKYVKLML